MKKYLLIVMCAILLLTVGCGKKNQVKCSGTQNEGGISLKASVIADFDQENKLTDATAEYDLSDKEAADQYCSLFKLMENAEKGVSVSCSGTKVTIKGFANIDDDEEEEKIIGLTKEEFIKTMEEEKLTCK